MAYSLKFPIDYNNIDGFELNEDLIDNCKQNLKMILLTDPGERIMNPDYGVGLKKFLFENISNGLVLQDKKKENLEKLIYKKLIDQTNKYNPEIIVVNVVVQQQENTVFVSIKYMVNGIIEQELTIKV